MPFSVYKHGVKTASPAPTGDAGLAINQNFATIADYLDGVLLTSGGTIDGFIAFGVGADLAYLQSDGFGGIEVDNGAGSPILGLSAGLAVTTNNNTLDDGSGNLWPSLNYYYPGGGTALANSGGLNFPDGSVFVDNTDNIYSGAGSIAIGSDGSFYVTGQLNLSDGLSLIASGYNMVYFTAGNWYFANEGQLGTNGGSTLDDGAGNMTVNGTTGLSIPNGFVAVGGNTVLSPSHGYCGSPVIGQYGGTGVNNGGKTITLGGNLITSGAYGITMTATATTSVTLPTSGTLLSSATPYSSPLSTKTLAYTLTATDSTILVNSSSNITMTLPTAASIAGREYTIKTINSAATVGTTSSQTIDGSTTYSLTANHASVTVVSDGANWQIIAKV